MDIQKAIVAWIFLAIPITIIFVILRHQCKKNSNKLDFIDWYWKDKAKILERVQKRSKLYGLDLEAELNKEYEAYLQS
jgi:hypothetical protein